MPRRNFLLPVAAVLGLALFGAGLIHVLLLRYERGDIYPPYSTLRTDPLGARAFYEALASTGSYQVERGLVSLHRELAENPATVLFLGLDPSELSTFTPADITSLSDYVQSGGRVVLALQPADQAEPAAAPKAKPGEKEEPEKEGKKLPVPAPEAPVVSRTAQEQYEREEFRKQQEAEDESVKEHEFPSKFEPSLPAVWGFGTDRHLSNESNGKDAPSEEFSRRGDPLAIRTGVVVTETKVPWKSAEYFLRLEPEWKILYRAQGRPVLIERPWGKGEILVSTDSYFLSNEALSEDRCPRLLSRLAGPPGPLLFDEVHLGTQKQEGVMVLAQRFRLEGYLYGMLAVGALYLWRNSVPLVPNRVSIGHSVLGGTVSGKDSRSGLINLLRRNIASREILKTCLAEWKRNVHPGQAHLQAKAAEMESLLAGTNVRQEAELVRAYHHLREINTGSRTKESHATPT